MTSCRQLDTKGRRKSVLTSPALSDKTSYYKEDSQEDIEDEEDADLGEEEFVDNSTDEDYQPEMTITRQSKVSYYLMLHISPMISTQKSSSHIGATTIVQKWFVYVKHHIKS